MSDERICGIFTIRGIRDENKIKLEHIENLSLKPHEYVNDTLIDQFKISPGISGETYKCNITDLFLMSNKRIPVSYANVTYERPLKKFLLFRINLYFTIESNIESSEQLLTDYIEGIFSLEIFLDGASKELDQIQTFPGNKKIYAKFKDFISNPETIQLTKSIVDDINTKIKEEYKAELEYYKPPKNIISLKNYKLDD